MTTVCSASTRRVTPTRDSEDLRQTLPFLRQDDAKDDEREHHDQHYSVGSVVLICRRYLLLLCNIAAWYTANGMNGISMQSFAAEIPQRADRLTKFTATVFVTALQILLGALLGKIMLLLYCQLVSTEGRNFRIDFCSSTRAQTLLALLHAAGSTFTNLGFLNGKASLVQVVKLFEPFETLLFTKLLIKDEGEMFTTGVVSSMCLTLGAALSLLPTKSNAAASYHMAIFFATLSGLSLSMRNVLQRRQHASSDTAVAQINDKLEKALVLFTQISIHSGRILIVFSIALWLALRVWSSTEPKDSDSNVSVTEILRHGLNGGLLAWHPLYNAFSMITLGFCSAVTHSLLNAGKRVYAIVMAILWFGEGFAEKTVVGLLLVALGGCWYTVEMKRVKVQNNQDNPEAVESEQKKTVQYWMKPLFAIILLQLDWSVFRMST